MGMGVLEEITEMLCLQRQQRKKNIFGNHRLLLSPTFLTQFTAEIT